MNDKSAALAVEFYNIGVEHGLELRGTSDTELIKSLAEVVARFAERI